MLMSEQECLYVIIGTDVSDLCAILEIEMSISFQENRRKLLQYLLSSHAKFLVSSKNLTRILRMLCDTCEAQKMKLNPILSNNFEAIVQSIIEVVDDMDLWCQVFRDFEGKFSDVVLRIWNFLPKIKIRSKARQIFLGSIVVETYLDTQKDTKRVQGPLRKT